MMIKRSKVLQRNHRFQGSYNKKVVKEIKRLKSLLVKAEAYSEPKQASTMELLDARLDYIVIRPPKIPKFSK